jgi:hypothetical protein
MSLEKIKESFEANLLRFEKFLNIVRGNQDVNLRANVILDPKNIKTSSNLSSDQVDFISISNFVAEAFPELEPLQALASEALSTNLSKAGFGVEHAIMYEQAIGEKRLMQLGLKPQDTPKEKVENIVKK